MTWAARFCAAACAVRAVRGEDALFSERSIDARAWDESRRVALADLDGDASLDAMCGGESGIAWYANDGHGSFSARAVVESLYDASRMWSSLLRRYVSVVEGVDLAGADYDGDGRVDVFATGDRGCYVLANGGGPLFLTRHDVWMVGGGPSIHALDVDGDSDVDVVQSVRQYHAGYASSYPDAIWHENIGAEDGFFRTRGIAAPIVGLGTGGRAVFGADVDGDGATDLFVAAESGSRSHTVTLYVSIAQDEITESLVIDDLGGGVGAGQPEAVYAADVDGDGDVDGLSASHYDGRVSWYENVDNAFVKRTVSSTLDNARSVLAVDVDGDGDLDVVAASASRGLVWFDDYAGGAKNFTARHGAYGPGAHAAAVGDLDGDGDIDLASSRTAAVGSADNDEIFWLENAGGSRDGACGRGTYVGLDGQCAPCPRGTFEPRDAHDAVNCSEPAPGRVPARAASCGAMTGAYGDDGSWKLAAAGSSCYYISERLSSWFAARQDCVARGGDLATIQGSDENAAVFEFAVGGHLDRVEHLGRDPLLQFWMWIGLNEVGRGGAWEWTNDKVCSWYRDWARVTILGTDGTTTTKQPYDGITTSPEECVAMSRDAGNGGLWADEICGSTFYAVCEAPVALGATADEACPRGMYAPPGAIECRSCDWGDFSTEVGATACGSCPTYSPAALLSAAFNGPRVHRVNAGGSVRCGGHLGRRQRAAFTMVFVGAFVGPALLLLLFWLFVEWPRIVRSYLPGSGLEHLRPVLDLNALRPELVAAFISLALAADVVAGGFLAHWISSFNDDSSQNVNTGRRTATTRQRGCDPEERAFFFAGGLLALALSMLCALCSAPVWPTRRLAYEMWQRARSAITRRRLRQQVQAALAEWKRERDARWASLASDDGPRRTSLACTLCQSERAAAINVPCHHLFLCMPCATLFRTESGDICHACRRPSELVDAVTRDRNAAPSLKRRPWHAFEAAPAAGADDGAPRTWKEADALYQKLKSASEEGGLGGCDSTRLREMASDVSRGRDSDAAAYLRTTCGACARNTERLVVDMPCGHASLCRECADEHRSRNGGTCTRCGAASALADPVRALVCSVCCDAVDARDLVTLDLCGHTICVGCSADFVRSALADVAGQVSRNGLKCPLQPTGCEGIVHLSTIRHLVTLETKPELLPITEWEFSRVERFIAEASIPESQRFYCTYADCAKVFRVDRADVPLESAIRSLRGKLEKYKPRFGRARVAPSDDDAPPPPVDDAPPFFVPCPHCNRASCFHCRIPAHRALTCDEAQAATNDSVTTKLIAATSKPCPKCNFGITHFHGHACHHIKPVTGCPNCGHNFCYRCRRPGKSGSACGCRLFCQNDGVEDNVVWNPYPHDRRCGCTFCSECQPGSPCPQCDGGCVLCRAKIPRAPDSLAAVKTWWPEGRARNEAHNT